MYLLLTPQLPAIPVRLVPHDLARINRVGCMQIARILIKIPKLTQYSYRKTNGNTPNQKFRKFYGMQFQFHIYRTLVLVPTICQTKPCHFYPSYFCYTSLKLFSHP